MRRRNATTVVLLSGLVAGMTGLSFAAVPLYRLFCQVTGLGGTTQVADSLPETVADRVMTVRFNADIDPELPWRFRPSQRAVEVRVGEPGLAFYEATNLAERPVTGTAVFNVTPLKAGRYFSKVACFCFDLQSLAAGETMEMGVSFFVDPEILDDPNLDDVTTITLSYTFFHSSEQAANETAEGASASTN
ncbi:MAG: cytochrome c oxidase assembly protein [Kiloniellales bacterium]|nr:cytochrome c oxidase assembly protein [Kiloniellales bacterium]